MNNITLSKASYVLLHYGKLTSDAEFKENINNIIYHTRIRTFIYNNRHYYHCMVNGKVKEIFELI